MLLFAGLAFLIASAVTALELLTAEYPYTGFVLTPRKCPAFYGYAVAYGILAALVYWLLEQGKLHEVVRLEGVGLDAKAWLAIYVGLSIKALLNIRVAEVRRGSISIPLGLATGVIPLETWLREKKLRLQEWNAVRYFVEPRARKYNDISDVRERIERNPPPHLAEDEDKALELDVEQKLDSVEEIMERYLRKVGKGVFNRVFPL